MPILFEGKIGRVIALQDPAVQAVLPLVTVDGNDPISFQARKSIVTRITLAQETNYQFLHTLGGDIFIYVFGDRIGQMTISGLSFARDCDDDIGQHGFERMLGWYNDNKLTRRRTPVTVLIGQTAVTGFVAAMTGSIFDHKLHLIQFDISMMVIPVKNPVAKVNAA